MLLLKLEDDLGRCTSLRGLNALFREGFRFDVLKGVSYVLQLPQQGLDVVVSLLDLAFEAEALLLLQL